MPRKKLCLTCPSHFPSRLWTWWGFREANHADGLRLSDQASQLDAACKTIHDSGMFAFSLTRNCGASSPRDRSSTVCYLLLSHSSCFLLFPAPITGPGPSIYLDVWPFIRQVEDQPRKDGPQVLTAARLAAAESTLLLEPFHGVYACVCNAAESDLDLNDRCSGLLLLR